MLAVWIAMSFALAEAQPIDVPDSDPRFARLQYEAAELRVVDGRVIAGKDEGINTPDFLRLVGDQDALAAYEALRSNQQSASVGMSWVGGLVGGVGVAIGLFGVAEVFVTPGNTGSLFGPPNQRPAGSNTFMAGCLTGGVGAAIMILAHRAGASARHRRDDPVLFLGPEGVGVRIRSYDETLREDLGLPGITLDLSVGPGTVHLDAEF